MAEEKKEPKEVKEEKEVKKEEKTEKKIEKSEAPKIKEPTPEAESPEEEVEIPAEFAEMVKNIEKMSVLDLSRLVKILEKKFHVSATPMMSAQPVATGAASAEGGEEEKSNYDVILTGTGDQKIQVIKVIRDITGKGLKDSKDLVDQAAQAPQVLKEGAKKDEAEDIKKKLEEAGAKVELK